MSKIHIIQLILLCRICGTREVPRIALMGDSDTRSLFLICLCNLFLVAVMVENPKLREDVGKGSSRVFSALVVISRYSALNFNPQSCERPALAEKMLLM